MHDLALAAFFLPLGGALLLPIRQIFDAVGANAELDDMQRHEDTTQKEKAAASSPECGGSRNREN
jgi:hypothetical protein